MRKIIIVFISLLLLSCQSSGAKVDHSGFYLEKSETFSIPDACKHFYSADHIPRVGIVEFLNNIQDRAIIPEGWMSWWGDVSVKLTESVADGVTGEVVNIGGVRIYTRTDLQKVMQEQKFQMSGLADSSTLVSLGKLAGLQYIITGSINNITVYTGAMTGLLLGAAPQVEVELAVRMIDVTTGEIIISTVLKGKHVVEAPNAVGVNSAIKNAASKAIIDLRPEFSKRFAVGGYIMQTKISQSGAGKLALISAGYKHRLAGGAKLLMYYCSEQKDFVTSKVSCLKSKIQVEAVVTDEIYDDKAWVHISGNNNELQKIVAGTIFERVPMEGQNIIQRFGF
ncbi:MAG: hypothetical protein HQL10_12845 [Nitrospirae bacterium]|nr:hypothetical protein [Nitrospirota bacterium]